MILQHFQNILMPISTSTTGLEVIDRLRIHSFFRKPTGSILGIIGTLGFLAVALYMFVPVAIEVWGGNFTQYQVVRHQIPSTTVESPKLLGLVLVFLNKTSREVANHTELTQQLKAQAFWADSEYSPDKFAIMRACEPDYFADAVNPMVLEDCLMFPKGSSMDFTIQSTNKASFGVQLTFDCFDPFGCARWGDSSTADLKQGLFMDLLEQYTPILYFSLNVLQKNGFFEPQVFKIEAAQFSTPFTITAEFHGQLHQLESTIQFSVLPWRNARGKKSLVWYGLREGQAQERDSYTDDIDWRLVASRYQTEVYRYYRKIDWLFGVVGGGVFLLYLFFWLPLHFINQDIQRRQIAADLLIDFKDFPRQNIPHPVSVSWTHIFTQFNPLAAPDPHMQTVKRESSITMVIQKLRTAERNIKERNMEPYKKTREIDYDSSAGTSNALLDSNSINESNQALGESSQQASSLSPQEEVAAKKLFLHRSVATTLKSQPKKMEYLACSPSLLMFTLPFGRLRKSRLEPNQQQALVRCEEIAQNEDYSPQPAQEYKSKGKRVWEGLVWLFRRIDIFGVKPNFNASPGNASAVGCFLTLVILGLSFMTLGVTLSHWSDRYPVVTQRNLPPKDILFSATTGDGFRPAFCSGWSGSSSVDDGEVKLQFYKVIKGVKSIINAIAMDYGERQLLGIGDDDAERYLSTSYCFRMPDGEEIIMGGIGTEHEAYWGVEVTTNCLETPATCLDQQDDYNEYVEDFFRWNSNEIILPNNQYDPLSKSIAQSGPVVIPVFGGGRQAIQNPVEETIYVDETQVRDSYTKKFLGSEPKVTKQGISVNIRQSQTYTKHIYGSQRSYMLKIRPSGHVTEVYQTSIGIETLIGMIGGTIFFWYVIIHMVAKAYNQLNYRIYLADLLYNQEMYQQTSFFAKLCHLTRIPLCLIPTCCDCRKTVEMLRFYNKKMAFDLSFTHILKDVDTVWRMSVAGNRLPAVKDVSMIYLKETVEKPYEEEVKVVRQNDGIVVDDNFIADEYVFSDDDQDATSRQSGHGIVNEEGPQELNLLPVQNQEKLMEDEIQFEQKNYEQGIDRVPAFDKFRYQGGSSFNEKAAWFDIFHSNPSFSLKGEWRVRSCFGTFCFLSMVTLCGIVFGYYVSGYKDNYYARVGKGQYMENPLNGGPLELKFTPRIAVGFHEDGTSSKFESVSSYINPNSEVKLSLYEQSLVRNGTETILTSTEHQLTPCPADYFEGYMSRHMDQSYDFDVFNGFCIENIDLLLSHSDTQSHYFKIKVENRTDDPSDLYDFTSDYVCTILMTVPEPDTDSKSFSYTVRPIRPRTSSAYWAVQNNITLTKMKMTYTEQGKQKTIESHSYIENKDWQRDEQITEWGYPESISILFSYGGLVETYDIKETSAAELFGLAGGVILFFYMILGCCAEGFNTYKMKYEVGRELYRLGKLTETEQTKHKKKVDQMVGYKKMEVIDADYWQIQLILTFLLSFPATLFRRYTLTDTLFHIHTLQSHAEVYLNLHNFMTRLRNAKDTLNSEFYVGHRRQIPISCLYSPKIVNNVDSTETPAEFKQINKEEAANHGMSVQDQWKWFKAEKVGVWLRNLYSYEFVRKNVMTKAILAAYDVRPFGQEEQLRPLEMQREAEIPVPGMEYEREDQIDYYRRIETPFNPTPRQTQAVASPQRGWLEDTRRKLNEEEEENEVPSRLFMPPAEPEAQIEIPQPEPEVINPSIDNVSEIPVQELRPQQGNRSQREEPKEEREASQLFDMIEQQETEKNEGEAKNNSRKNSSDKPSRNFEMIDDSQDEEDDSSDA